MKVNGIPRRTIRLSHRSGKTLSAVQALEFGEDAFIEIIDQTALPHRFELKAIHRVEEMAEAIRTMQVRGAPLIGASAAWGMWLALRRDSSDEALQSAAELLITTRPTAVNLRWAVDRVKQKVMSLPKASRALAAGQEAEQICEEDVESCMAIGRHGARLIEDIASRKGAREAVRILTHCNAGWLATVDFGTALSPIYTAHDAGIALEVWVDETRPRNQGASLTAWELGSHGVPHTVIADNAAGHLMQRGEVDLVIVGTDRSTRRGDVCNKIGTYTKALAARDNGIPFYVAAPVSSIDFSMSDGLREIPIEERDPEELSHLKALDEDGQMRSIRLIPKGSTARNPAFDVTPARLVDGLITEYGIFQAKESSLEELQRLIRSEARENAHGNLSQKEES